jgi:predicted membrane-bound spermidine synthase
MLDKHRSKILSFFFFVSGFCALLYQLVYLRLALSAFGVVTPVVSLVLSVFMCGLGVGGWLGGRYIDKLRKKTRISAIGWYGASEIAIGLGAFAVPASFAIGRNWLLSVGQASSSEYLLLSALIISVSLFPWTAIMGTTFVFGMAFFREFPDSENRTFGLLYAANVAGAVFGTMVTAFILIEIFGFRHTLQIAAALNFLIGLMAILWGLKRSKQSSIEISISKPAPVDAKGKTQIAYYAILFLTGFSTMAMEVVWTRAFSKYLLALVYSFALLLVFYLSATTLGSLYYRSDIRKGLIKSKDNLLVWCGIFVCLPIILTDPRLPLLQVLISLVSIVPFSFTVGYLTPMLIDELSRGNEETAGKAYAVNVIGCVIGPLVAGYLLLPFFGAKQSLILLAAPFLLLVINRAIRVRTPSVLLFSGTSLILFIASFFCLSWEDGTGISTTELNGSPIYVSRDHVATTLAYGQGPDATLLVNGFSMTKLEPSVKMMAHLPLAFHEKPVHSFLVICFGMGTTFRSALTWDVPVTAVELVPGVPKMFSHFWTNAPSVLSNPGGHIIIDDGRRFLARGTDKFDIISIDPPQPLMTAGSSLLYSKEFYQTLKQHLQVGGIVQEYLPGIDDIVLSTVTRSMKRSFRFVKIYKVFGGWGYHLFASDEPFPEMTAEQIIARMPPKALADYEEFVPDQDKLEGTKKAFKTVLDSEVKVPPVLSMTPEDLTLDDDRPLNEYFLLRAIRRLQGH